MPTILPLVQDPNTGSKLVATRAFVEDTFGIVAPPPSGGDDAPIIRALFDTENATALGATVILSKVTTGGTTYLFETPLDLRQREVLVIPAGVTVERPVASTEVRPLIRLIRNEARVIGEGLIRSYSPTPQGVIKFGPEEWVETYAVSTAAGSGVMTGTFDPVPAVGDIAGFKTNGDSYVGGFVTAASASSITIDVNATSADADGRLFTLAGPAANIVGASFEGPTIWGDDDPTSVGIAMQSVPQGSSFGTFQNRVERSTIRKVGTGILFDAQANGNVTTDVMPLQITAGICYSMVNTDENSINGGFVHSCFNSTMLRIERGGFHDAHFSAEAGGASSLAFDIVDDQCYRNNIRMMDNIAGGFVDNGDGTNSYDLSAIRKDGHQRFDGGQPWVRHDIVATDRTKNNDGDINLATEQFEIADLLVGIYKVEATLLYNSSDTADFRAQLDVQASTGSFINAAISGRAPLFTDPTPNNGSVLMVNTEGSVLQAGGSPTVDGKP